MPLKASKKEKQMQTSNPDPASCLPGKGKKALMHAHTAYMVTQFNIDNIKILQSLGYEVDVACCWNDDDSALSKEALEAARKKLEDLGCEIIETASLRKILDIGELSKAYKQLKKRIDTKKYAIVHTQSPIGGVICRLAARNARKKFGTKVIYAAHGFHFFEGAPKKNWIIYYNAEKFCAKFTDLLITINQEDFKNASKKFKAGQVVYVPGAGVDIHKFAAAEDARERVRTELGLEKDTVALLSVGELIPRKNHVLVLDALKTMKEQGLINCEDKPKVCYFIAGRGKIEAELKAAIEERGLSDTAKLLGFRRDVADVFAASDIYVFPSHQEGLPVALMEAMSVGLPCVASKIRGNVDLISEGVGGVFFDSHDWETLVEALEKMLSLSRNEWQEMGSVNMDTMQSFDKDTVNASMRQLYEEIGNED